MPQTLHPRAARSPDPAARLMTMRRLGYVLIAGLIAFAAVNAGGDAGQPRLSAADATRGLDRAA